MKKYLFIFNIFILLLLISCTVTPDNNKIESINTSKNEITLYIGDQEKIEYTITPSNIDQSVIWSVENPDIATIDEGIVTGIKRGETFVTITSSKDTSISTKIKIEVTFKEYEINYILNGGYFEGMIIIGFSENTGIIQLPIPIRKGYIFKGWYLDNELVTEIHSSIKKDITLTAKWEKQIKTYNITYNTENGYLPDDVPKTFPENIGLDTLPIPTKEGYKFLGWYLDNELVEHIDPNTNKHIILTAKWEYIPKIFTITYDLDGGTLPSDIVNNYTENIGLDSLPIPLKAGYKFLGWYLNNEPINLISPNINKDITITAKWEYIPLVFGITYELDGGYLPSDVASNFTENIGLEILPTPTKDDYNFVGWMLDGNIVNSINRNINKDIILIAVWEIKYDVDAANNVINLINTLPYNTTYNDKIKIEYIYNSYNKLNSDTKTLVTNIDLLSEKLEVLKSIENNNSEITYVLGNNIYLSKHELFENFFSDFYTFIINNYGDTHLKENNISSISDFVSLACDFDGAGVSNLYGIGNLAGRYMLTKDINGILENQPDSTFFGYCYKNGLYKDLLPFFIRFFAYWRIDEGYAKESNYGADIFAESWAPTVDIAKFFYYTDETSYVKTERMIDCFINTACVCYGDLPTNFYEGMILPNDLKLRGYVFEGWYDNPYFTGDKITTITDTSKKIILYAKWSIDQNQQEKDKAEIVDIYIYNLTTDPAVLSKKTVQYVRDMYDALSKDGQEQVEKYNTLIKYEEEFADNFLEPVTLNITTKLNKNLSLETIRNTFINDFNLTTNSKIKNIDEFISSRYTYMKKLNTFFKDKYMKSKWIYLLDLLSQDGCARGLQIQLERIKSSGTGDLEYVCKAIAYLLLGQDATSDSEILVDYSSKNIQDNLLSSFGCYNITFEKETYLPTITIYGYEFIGFYDVEGNIITKVTENMVKDIIAVYN